VLVVLACRRIGHAMGIIAFCIAATYGVRFWCKPYQCLQFYASSTVLTQAECLDIKRIR
jgi:hypothetical protein